MIEEYEGGRWKNTILLRLKQNWLRYWHVRTLTFFETPCIHACKNENIQLYKYVSMHTSIQLCKFMNLHVSKYASI